MQYEMTHEMSACVGQGLRNVFSAREFVWWYNGHPDYRDLPLDLSAVLPSPLS